MSSGRKKMSDLEMEKEFLEAAKIEWMKVQRRKIKLKKGKSKIQRDIEEVNEKVERIRREHLRDPVLREIDKRFKASLHINGGRGGLVCPVCGGKDQGNKMNDKPWCFECNTRLVPKNKIKKWLPLIRNLNKTDSMNNQLNILNPGLHPKNEEDQ